MIDKEQGLSCYREQFEFNDQFSKPETLGAIELLHIKPEIIDNKTPLIIAPGFSRTPKTFKNSMRVLYEAERETNSIIHTREGGSVELSSCTWIKSQKKY